MLSVETGKFGFVDMYNTKMMGTKKLVCELTLRRRQGGVRPERHLGGHVGRDEALGGSSAVAAMDDVQRASIWCDARTEVSAVDAGGSADRPQVKK